MPPKLKGLGRTQILLENVLDLVAAHPPQPVNSHVAFEPLSKEPGVHIKEAARRSFDLCYYLDLVSSIKRVQ